MAERKTTEQFIKDAILIHGHKFDYSLVKYTGAHNKVKIICPSHGIFEQKPNSHLNGRGCRDCWYETLSKIQTIDTEEFIKRAKSKHGNKYDYSLVHYVDSKTLIEIICSVHGTFKQLPNSHLNGSGCQLCGFDKLSDLFSYDKETFIDLSNKLFNKEYDYSLVEYKNTVTPVKIICPSHGIFSKRPSKHLQGQGCPECVLSLGEKQIAKILRKLNIKFIRQKRFTNCKNENPLPFDFYFEIDSRRFLIEYDGRHHFESIPRWGGKKALRQRQHHDTIKTKFAQDNGYILIRIPYTEFDNIETILTNAISRKDI